MQNLKVTLVQANQIWESPEANYSNYMSLLNGVETDLILLPEMFQTCFTMNRKWADPFDSSEGLDWLKELAVQQNSAVYTSLMVKDGDAFYNRGVFITPEKEVFTYDKRKTFGLAKENNYFSAGQSETIVAYKGWKFQLQICYDLRFPEIVRNNVSNHSYNYDVILYVANWPKKRSTHWKALLRARAIENQCYVFGVNRVGTDGLGFEYSGDSTMVDALGQEKTLTAGTEMVQTFVTNSDELKEIREKLPFLRDV